MAGGFPGMGMGGFPGMGGMGGIPFSNGHRHKELCRQGSVLFSFCQSIQLHLLCLEDFGWHFYGRQLLLISA